MNLYRFVIFFLLFHRIYFLQFESRFENSLCRGSWCTWNHLCLKCPHVAHGTEIWSVSREMLNPIYWLGIETHETLFSGLSWTQCYSFSTTLFQSTFSMVNLATVPLLQTIKVKLWHRQLPCPSRMKDCRKSPCHRILIANRRESYLRTERSILWRIKWRFRVFSFHLLLKKRLLLIYCVFAQNARLFFFFFSSSLIVMGIENSPTERFFLNVLQVLFFSGDFFCFLLQFRGCSYLVVNSSFSVLKLRGRY